MSAAQRWEALKEAITARRTEAKLSLRVMVGVCVAFGFYQVLHLPQGYWAVFTVIIVMQGSIGGTVGVAVDRMYGTLLGAAVGGVAAALRPQTPEWLAVALVLSVGVTSLCAAIRPNLKVAPVTSAIMLLSATGGMEPLQAAAFRVLEIGLGGVIGVLATVLVFPAPSRPRARRLSAKALNLIADMLERCALALEHGGGGETNIRDALQPDHDRLRELLAQVEQTQKEADQERSARLGGRGDPPAVLRGLWRARNGVVAIGRACTPEQPQAVRERIAGPGAALIRAEARRARACGVALVAGRRVDREDLAAIDATFLDAIEALRREPATADLSFDDVGHVLGLAFSAEDLRRDLDDLANRLDELAGGGARRPRRLPAVTMV